MKKETKVGVVIIGRNEGMRLVRCFASLAFQGGPIVYVDSGSTDDSVNVARRAGAEVVALDMSVPFTAARARNAGFERLRMLFPQMAYVQFIDGDCEMAPGWLQVATSFLDVHYTVAAVCGRRREQFPNSTVYNLLCDMEWDTPVGEAKECGGDVLMRARAFEQLHGFRAEMIAGEEPELCVRLRAASWKIWRLDREMTLHDAAMTRFGQWWKRMLRSGYASAEGARLHGASPERHRVRETWRAWIWGLGIPAVTTALVLALGMRAMVLLAVYPLQFTRLALRGTYSAKKECWLALFLVLGKFPEALGQIKYLYNRIAGKRGRLIEYK